MRAAIVSFRLGGGDGVSVEARKWAWALSRLGFTVSGVAGEGIAERLLPALGMGERACELAGRRLASGELLADLEEALRGADVVVVENLCSLPLNPAAAEAVSRVLAGRPAVLHHHDLPWQRERFAAHPPPPDDAAWAHVTVNERSRRELAALGIPALTLYNAFDPDPRPGRRRRTRAALGLADDDLLVLQPTRALARKRVGAAVALAERLGATYWLLGPAEDGYDRDLERILAAAACPVRRGRAALARIGGRGGTTPSIADAYAACDVVALPSSWEGFGNPALESATHRRPLFVGRYPVAEELAAFGFDWFFDDEAGSEALLSWLAGPDHRLLERNAAVARQHFSLGDLPGKLADVLAARAARPAATPGCDARTRARGGR